MASPRSTPFIASWDSEDLPDATVPLGEFVVRNAPTNSLARRSMAPAAFAPPRRAWSVVGCAAALAAGALLGSVESNQPRTNAIASPPPSVRAELQSIPTRIDMTPPAIEFAAADEPAVSPRPQARPLRKRLESHDELAAALLERRKQLSQGGTARADVDAVAAISFDSSRRSARVIYHVDNSAAEVVEYWAVRDGRWQPLDD